MSTGEGQTKILIYLITTIIVYSGYALIHGRFAVDNAAASLQSFLNPLPNVLTYVALSTVPFPANTWVLALVQLLSLLLLALICQEVDHDFGHDKPSAAALLALLLSVLAPLWGSELGTSFFDATLAPIVLVGLLFGLRGMAQATEAQPAFGALLLAGCAISFAIGLKLTNAVFAVGLLSTSTLKFQHNSQPCAGSLYLAKTCWRLPMAGGISLSVTPNSSEYSAR